MAEENFTLTTFSDTCKVYQVEGSESAGRARQSPTMTNDRAVETAAALPHPDAVLEAAGEGCASLTPRIRGGLRELESGQILDVRTDDPTAYENLQAWCRLTGHTLMAVGSRSGQGQRFLIRKK